MRVLRLIGASAFLAAAWACGDGMSGANLLVPFGAKPVPYELLSEAHTTHTSGFETRSRSVILSEARWTAIWDEFVGAVEPEPALPIIDFERDMVIVAAMGRRNTGGYSIAIAGIFELEDVLYIHVVEASPGASCATTQALTSPATAVVLARFSGDVRFVEETKDTSCP